MKTASFFIRIKKKPRHRSLGFFSYKTGGTKDGSGQINKKLFLCLLGILESINYSHQPCFGRIDCLRLAENL